MADEEAQATQSAYLALQEERQGMQEGYRFLDEKRLILAAEILAQLKAYEEQMAELKALLTQAREALAAAIARHGLEGLTLYPAPPQAGAAPAVRSRVMLGVTLQTLAGDREPPAPEGAPGPAADPSPEAEACREAFRALVPRATQLAVLLGNLERLRREYRRTARRARALEDVLIPETDEALKRIASALEELDREDAMRVRALLR